MISMAGFEDPELKKLKEQERLAAEAKAAPGLLQTAIEKPMTPFEQLRDNHGTGGAIMRLLGTGLSGGLMGGLLTPEIGKASQAEYATDLATYKAYQTKMMEQQLADQAAQAERDRFAALGTGLRDAFVTEGMDDDLEAVMAARAGGMDLADIKHFQQMAGQSYKDPSWETKFDNGVLVRYDKNSDSPAQVVLGDDGKPITEKMDSDMRKTSGWFKRAVPALENMHKLEDRGVDVSRETLTLLAQAAQNEDGIVVPQLFNQALNKLNLNADQRQYIRNARDLAMIQLRKESGAAIGVSEMFNELEQNLMISDMSPEGYEYQRGARNRKYRALAEGMPSYLIDEFKADGYFDTLDKLRAGSARRDPSVWDGERTDFSNFKDEDFEKVLDSLPPGEYIAPNGKTIIWDGPEQLGSNVFGRKK